MLDINYLRMKRILLKDFKNQRIYIETQGTFTTRFWIDKARILINKHKIVISNEDIDCTILLDMIKKAKIDGRLRIELIGLDSRYILEI